MRWLVEYKSSMVDRWTVVAAAISEQQADTLLKGWRTSHPLYEWRVRLDELPDDKLGSAE